MVYISRLFVTLTIALMLFGCAKDKPIILTCGLETYYIYPEEGKITWMLDGYTVDFALVTNFDSYDWLDSVGTYNSINRSTLIFSETPKGKTFSTNQYPCQLEQIRI